MGISCIGSNSSYEFDVAPKKLPNPDPRNFEILRSVRVKSFTIVEINYPDCKNYEGNKIMVYEATVEELTAQGHLDPHFSNSDLRPEKPIANVASY